MAGESALPLRVSAVSTQVPCPLSRCVSVHLHVEMGDADGSQAGHSEPRSPASPEPCPGVKEGPEAPLLTVWSLCLGTGWLPGPHPGWRPRPDTGLDLRHGPTQPYTCPARAKATQTGAARGPRASSARWASLGPGFLGVESAFALQLRRLVGTVCHCSSGGQVLCV